MNSLAGGNNALFSPFGTGGGDMFNTGKFSVGVTAGKFSANNLVSYSPGPPASFVTETFSGADLVAGTSYLVVGRMTINAAADATDTLNVWFNPANASRIASLGAAQVTFANQDFSTPNVPADFRTSGSSGVFLNGLTVGIRRTTANYIDSIRLAFGGTSDENFAAVTTAAMPTTTTTLASSANPSALGDEVTFTATVNSSAATGTVTFKEDANILGTVNLVNGTATYSTSALTVGPHNITATYDGSPYYITSTSEVLGQQVSNFMTPLQTWYQSFSLPTDGTGDGANTADPDHDGIQNLVEYALGGNPTVSNASILPASSVVAGKLQFSFSCDDSRTDITYRVEAGDNLSKWTEIASSTGGTLTAMMNASGALVSDSGSGIRAVTVTDSAIASSTPKRFLRLKVTNP